MKDSQRAGVIIAAGLGLRLRTISAGKAKPLLYVSGQPLIIRVINNLEVAGCRKIVIVLGYRAAEIQEAIISSYTGTARLVFVENRDYELANGVSVLAARNEVEDIFLLTMSDHIFDRSIIEKAGKYIPENGCSTLFVDYKIDQIFDMDDATKVLEIEGNIKSIGKTIKEYNCIDTGLFVCTRPLLSALENVYRKKGDASLSDGVQILAEQEKMKTFDIGDGFWQDVDTPEMVEYAEEQIKKRKL